VALFVLAVAVGWMALVPRTLQRPLALLAGTALFALALATPFWIIRPAFAPPPFLSPAQVAAWVSQGTAPLGDNGEIKLLHVQLNPTRVKPGQDAQVRVVWGAVRPIAQSYRVVVEATDLRGNVVGRTMALPWYGRFSTQRWPVGEFFADEYLVKIDALAPRGAAQVRLRLFAQYPTPHTVAERAVGYIKIAAPQLATQQLAASPIAQFGDEIELHTFAVTNAQSRFVWRVRKPIDTNYTLFFHVLDAQGQLIWQRDSPPFDGHYPTSLWDADDVIEEWREANLQGASRVLVGWYDASSGVRLPATKPSGARWPDNAVVVWQAP
jgi:hypothetical protein